MYASPKEFLAKNRRRLAGGRLTEGRPRGHTWMATRERERRNQKKREMNQKKREIKKEIDNMTVDRLKYYLGYLGLEKKGLKEELKTRLRVGCRPEALEKHIYK